MTRQPKSTVAGNWFVNFMASSAGRRARILAGIALVNLGIFVVGGPVGLAMAIFGLLPVASGLLNLCPVAPIWGGHFLGAKHCGQAGPVRGASQQD